MKKINWATGIVIAFTLFITFILYFVYKVQSDTKYDNEMVTEEYYKKEKGYQKQLDKSQNAHDLLDKVTIKVADGSIVICFPKTFDYSKIKGTIAMYRPSNQKLDFEMPITLSSCNLVVPKTNLVGGIWDISINWQYQGKEYLNQQQVNL